MQYIDTLPTEQYTQLFTEKAAHLTQLLSPFGVSDIDTYASPVSHFRMRAEFGIWHEGDDFNYTVFGDVADDQTSADRPKKVRVNVSTFPVACDAINHLMPQLKAALQTHPILNQKLFQVEFLATLSGDMLVTLIYHKPLTDEWIAQAKPLEAELGCYIMGRSRKQKVVLSQDFVTEKLTAAMMGTNHSFVYKQLEGGFTQPNAQVCQHMLSWACQQAEHIDNARQTDLLELYCGNGNFTLPLSAYFRNTLATEISKTSVAAAKWNIAANQSNALMQDNPERIKFARLSAEEFTEALSGQREFRRLKQEGVILTDYAVSTVFVDPPRAGIDENTLALISQFDHIIYISCNPTTLADNLATLCKTHRVKRAALFDQFPYTHHIEAGVFLTK